MEDVWKDLSLSSLHHPAATTTTTTTSSVTAFHQLGISFQDFLSTTTPARERATGHDHSSTSENSYTAAAAAGNLFGSTPLTIPEPWLSLNLTRDDQLLNVESSKQYGQKATADSLCPPRTVEFPILQKRIPESDNIISNEKKMRLIKSRESADRCRARKQAYTQELEIKLQQLKKENAKLKIELHQKKPIRLPEKNRLQRTLTAPF